MGKFKYGESKEYLKKINQTARETKHYYNTLVNEIAHCLETSTESAGSVVLCDEDPNGNRYENRFTADLSKPEYPMFKYIVVTYPWGYYTKKKCLGMVRITEDFEKLLLSEGWEKGPYTYDIQYELILD